MFRLKKPWRIAAWMISGLNAIVDYARRYFERQRFWELAHLRVILAEVHF